MARVHVNIRGVETRAEALEIAGADRRFHHPFGRYAQNPHDWRSPLQPTRSILSKRHQRALFNLGSRIELSGYDHSRYLFTDYWDGKEQVVNAVVSRPLSTPLVPVTARIALVTKWFDDGKDTDDSMGSANEVLLQVTDDPRSARFRIWQTVAGIMVGDVKHEQRGFVDPDILFMPEATSAEVLDCASGEFLGRLVAGATTTLNKNLHA